MKIKAVAFDLEGTLFQSKKLSQAHMSQVLEFLSKRMGISSRKALQKLESERVELASKLGFNPPLTVAIEEFGINRQEFYDVISGVDPGEYLRKDEKLQEFLILLKKNFRIALLTNVERGYSQRVLSALGVDLEVFDSIITGSDVVRVKPNQEPFYRIIKTLNLSPMEILMVGDRIDVDLVPAKQLGMRTAFVCKRPLRSDGRDVLIDLVLLDIYDLIDILEKKRCCWKKYWSKCPCARRGPN